MAGNKETGSGTIKLTITMLVSNRIDTIRKCMDSINPLLQKIPSELIVVDTGSTDGSIDIVREYTDNIVPFAWCNDFAAARNAGLKEAKGEWVMFLDDDEWFEDVTEIIEFFDSGEYKDYNSGIYTVRNYGNEKGTVWVDSNAQRMVKRFPETEFRGAVHECLAPQFRPTRYFSAYAHHYGYAYASEEARWEHSRRNIMLIQKELEHDPDDLRMITQAVQEYMGMNELYKVLELCDRARELYERKPQYKAYLGYCHNVSLRVYMKMENWKQAYEWGGKLLDEGLPTTVSYMGTIREMIRVCRKAGKYPEGIICLKKYLELYDALKENSVKDEICFDLSRYLKEEDHGYACLDGMQLAVLSKEWELAEECFTRKNWNELPLTLFPDTLDYVIELWTMLEYKQEYSDILDCILRGRTFCKQVWNNVQKYAEKGEKAYHKLLRIIANCKDDSVTSKKYRFLYYASLGQIPEDISLEGMLEEIWEGSRNPLLWDAEVWDAVQRKNLSVSHAVVNTPYDQWFIYVRQWLETCMEEDESRKLNEEDASHINGNFSKKEGFCVDGRDRLTGIYDLVREKEWKTDDLYMQFLDMKYEEGIMRRKLQDEGDVLSCLEKHCDRTIRFYSQIYRQELFQKERATLLPPDGAFAVFAKMAAQGKREGDQEAYIQFIGKAAKSYPVMKELCKELLQKEKEVSQNGITDAEQLEFVQLAEQMKDNIRMLLVNGNRETAKQIILQLKTLIPGDEELEKLERMAEENMQPDLQV